MSKIAKRVIIIPDDVSVSFVSQLLKINGPNASSQLLIPNQVNIQINDGNLITLPAISEQKIAIVGTFNSIISSLIKGSKQDFKKSLAIRGVGYRAEVTEKIITLHLGYSHLIKLEIPSGISAKFSSSILTISGPDKQKVGWYAAKIREFRLPNPFVKSLKGIFYHDLETAKDEKITIKSGKRDSK